MLSIMDVEFDSFGSITIKTEDYTDDGPVQRNTVLNVPYNFMTGNYDLASILCVHLLHLQVQIDQLTERLDKLEK